MSLFVSTNMSSLNATRQLFTSNNNLNTALKNEMSRIASTSQFGGVNVSAARSRIRDTDFAVKTAELARWQIIQQASVTGAS